jgi:hypothetical protein
MDPSTTGPQSQRAPCAGIYKGGWSISPGSEVGENRENRRFSWLLHRAHFNITTPRLDRALLFEGTLIYINQDPLGVFYLVCVAFLIKRHTGTWGVVNTVNRMANRTGVRTSPGSRPALFRFSQFSNQLSYSKLSFYRTSCKVATLSWPSVEKKLEGITGMQRQHQHHASKTSRMANTEKRATGTTKIP